MGFARGDARSAGRARAASAAAPPGSAPRASARDSASRTGAGLAGSPSYTFACPGSSPDCGAAGSGGGRGRGWSGIANLEVTGEGENRRVRRLVFVGPGKGPYDALGNLVGDGDHDLVVDVSADLARVSRVAASARATWQFGASEAWR